MPAQQRDAAALTAQNDDVLVECEVPIPGHEYNTVAGNLCQNPMVTGLLLNSANTLEYSLSSHVRSPRQVHCLCAMPWMYASGGPVLRIRSILPVFNA